jgi:Family of unknown function (DUF6479)
MSTLNIAVAVAGAVVLAALVAAYVVDRRRKRRTPPEPRHRKRRDPCSPLHGDDRPADQQWLCPRDHDKRDDDERGGTDK